MLLCMYQIKERRHSMFTVVFNLVDIFIRQHLSAKWDKMNLHEMVKKQMLNIIIFIIKEIIKNL